MAVADQLHRLIAIQLLITRFQVNFKVLREVVIIHIKGDFKINASNGIYQLSHRVPLNGHGKIRLIAHQLGNLFLQKLHSLFIVIRGVIIHGVEPLDIPGDIDHGIPRQREHTELLVRDVVGYQHHGVGIAAAEGILSYQEEGPEIVLPIAADLAWGFTAVLCFSSFSLVGRSLRPRGIYGPLGLLGKEIPPDEDGHNNGSQYRGNNKKDVQQPLPGRPNLLGPFRTGRLFLHASPPLGRCFFLSWVHSCYPFVRSSQSLALTVLG